MVVRKITIGAREFSVSGITLGTARRQPAALNMATKVLKAFAEADDDVNLAPTPEEADAIVALIVDGIQAAKIDDGITADVVNELVNGMSVADGTVQLFNAVGMMFKDDAKVSADSQGKEDTSGNSGGSESAT